VDRGFGVGAVREGAGGVEQEAEGQGEGMGMVIREEGKR